jgi:hypothetical protein
VLKYECTLITKSRVLILNTQFSILNYKNLKAEQPRQWSKTLSACIAEGYAGLARRSGYAKAQRHVVAEKVYHVTILSGNGSHNVKGSDMRDHDLSRSCGSLSALAGTVRVRTLCLILATPAVVADPVGGRPSSHAEGGDPTSWPFKDW